MGKFKALVLFSLIAANFVYIPSPVVEVEQGLVRGQVSENGQYFQYLGIPYARTSKETRFQAPLSPRSWRGVYDAINENSRCPQGAPSTRRKYLVIGEEDCLKLNVYVPVNRLNRPIPVMVYIHGGAFLEGSGLPALYGADFLVAHGVILVSINYRLNIQGFLCLGIKEAPGNAGLKDQIAALKWVKSNIKAFGGDPDNITLFGESAGAVSASILSISPATTDLFHRAILQSGSSLTPFGTQHDPLGTAANFAKLLGFDAKDPYELYNLFMSYSDIDLVATKVPRPKGDIVVSELFFKPCVEKVIPGIESVITDTPLNILKSGNYQKIPLIVGFNDKEAMLFVSMENSTTLAELDIKKTLPPDLDLRTEVEKSIIAERVREFYFGQKNVTSDTLLNLSEYVSDVYFVYPPLLESELRLKFSDQPIYHYYFRYNGKINMPKYISGFINERGASHADELFYMFKPTAFPLPQRFVELEMIERVTTMWTNFAKWGDPTPNISPILPVKWHPNRSPDLSFLHIDQEMEMGPLPNGEGVRLWNETYSKHRKKAYPFANLRQELEINSFDRL